VIDIENPNTATLAANEPVNASAVQMYLIDCVFEVLLSRMIFLFRGLATDVP
jgi:hypothetical protein